MANFFETSFVPQQTLVKVEAGGGGRREPLNVALVAALIIFFVTVAVAGGMYFWEKNTIQKKDAAGKELVTMEKNFDINKINSYKSLQSTLRNAKTLVDDHTIFSALLDNIEKNAAENIGLTSLAFDKVNDKSALLLSGQATSYKAVFFQVQTWRGMKPLFQKVEVTSLSLSEMSGIVNFSAKIDVDTKSLSFEKYLASSATAPTAVIVPAANDNDGAVAALSSTLLVPVEQKPLLPLTKASTTRK